MAVVIPEAVLRGIEDVRQSGKTNMLDRPAVQFYANQNAAYETVVWLEEHKAEYAAGVFEGFLAKEEE